MTSLFSPLKLGAMQLPNRIIMAPLTRSRAAEGNVPSDLAVTYYQQRASAGLILTEATPICAEGHGYIRTPGIHTAEQIAGWKKVTAAVHQAGGRIACQLWHVGRISHPDFQPNGGLPVAPSAIRPQGQTYTASGMKDLVSPRALEATELPQLVAQFVTAAKAAIDAGFDAVEIHAGNGYLLDQFLRSSTNHRQDNYGGSIANRARLVLDIVDAVCAAIGKDRTGIRLSPVTPFNDISDETPQQTFEYVVSELDRRDIAFLDILRGTGGAPEADWLAFDYARFRTIYRGNLLLNNGFDQNTGEAALANGDADGIIYGRLFIANPDLPERFRQKAPLNPVDYTKLYVGEASGYTDYPSLNP